MNLVRCNRGSTVFLGIIAFIVSIFLFSFSLPIIRSLIDNIWDSLGSVEQFMVMIIPFFVFFFIVFGLVKLVGGE